MTSNIGGFKLKGDPTVPPEYQSTSSAKIQPKIAISKPDDSQPSKDKAESEPVRKRILPSSFITATHISSNRADTKPAKSQTGQTLTAKPAVSKDRTPPKVCASRDSVDGQDSESTVLGQKRPRTDPNFLDGMVFVFSGIVNPERTRLRQLLVSMGGAYRPDWTHDATHLLTRSSDTPKYRLMKQSGHGVAVSPEYLLECHRQERRLAEQDFLVTEHVPSSLSSNHAPQTTDGGSNPLGLPDNIRLPDIFTNVQFTFDPQSLDTSTRHTLRRVIYAGNGFIAHDVLSSSSRPVSKRYTVVADRQASRSVDDQVPASWLLHSFRAKQLLPL